MTLTEMIDKVRQLSRTSVSAVSSTEMTDWINEGQRQFAKETGGLYAEDYLQLVGKFDTRTFFAFKIETTGTTPISETNIEITATERTDTDGDTVASDLQTELQVLDPGFTVSWSEADRCFTISQTGATSITISAPDDSYVDATALLFGGAIFSSADSVTGGYPEGLYIEASLPADFQTVVAVYWDLTPLRQVNFSTILPNSTGDPWYYAITEDRLRLYPVPTSQGMLRIVYRKMPSDLDYASAPDGESDIPSDYHMTVVYYAASKVADSNFEYEIGQRLYAYFKDSVKRFKRERANENGRIGFSSSGSVFNVFSYMTGRYLT